MDKKIFYALESGEIRQGLKIKIENELYFFPIRTKKDGEKILKNLAEILNAKPYVVNWYLLG